jgi:predicted DNA-binding transcriptional regulator AlpA
MSKAVEKEFMAVKDVSATGLCSQATAYNMMNRVGVYSDFPSIRIGKALRVKRTDFYEWIKKQKVGR